MSKIVLLMIAICLPNLFASGNEKIEVPLKNLQSDTFWKEQPKQAVDSLKELLKLDVDRGIPILIKRFDGWSNPNTKAVVFGTGPSWTGKENYTLMQAVSELGKDGSLKLIQQLATTDLKLTGEQTIKMEIALEQAAGSFEGFMAQIRKAVKKYKLGSTEVKQLKSNLSLNVEIQADETK